MCYLCLNDFEFYVEEPQKDKKKRILKIKSLLQLVAMQSNIDFCQDKIEELKTEQYELSRWELK